MSSQHHLILLYWIQLVTPLLFVAFSTVSVVRIWKDVIAFGHLALLLASVAICGGELDLSLSLLESVLNIYLLKKDFKLSWEFACMMLRGLRQVRKLPVKI